MAQYKVRRMNYNVSVPRKLGKTTIVTHGMLRVKTPGPFIAPPPHYMGMHLRDHMTQIT